MKRDQTAEVLQDAHLCENKRVIVVNWEMMWHKCLRSNQSSLKWNQPFHLTGPSFIHAWHSPQTKVAHCVLGFFFFFQPSGFGSSTWALLHLLGENQDNEAEKVQRLPAISMSYRCGCFVLVSSLPNNFKYNPPNPRRRFAAARLYVV